jgi:DMSO/TMAO reductase YedYZ molybdopterin-dependent catalytic subunit
VAVSTTEAAPASERDDAPASRWRAAIAGALGAAVALGTSELLAGLTGRAPSLILGVADLVTDAAPGGVVRWTIDTLGTTQKAALVTGIVVLSLAVGAVLGVVGRTRFWAAVAGFAAFGLLGAWAAARESLSTTAWAWAAAAVATGAGVFTLWWLLRVERAAEPDGEPTVLQRIGVPDRRSFLVASGVAAAWAVIGAGTGWRLRQMRGVTEARDRVAARVRSAAGPLPAPDVQDLRITVDGVSPLVTANDDFYRIDTAFLVPQVDPGTWTLRVTGMVDREMELDLDDLLDRDWIDGFITMQCVSNEVGGDLIGNALWSGVPLAALLEEAGVQPEATQVVGRSVDGWTAGFPTEAAVDGRPSMVAIAMNGEPLPVNHGFPARLIVPGLYGYVSATKWLAEIELTTWEAFDGYWIPRGWSKEGPIKTQSRIDVPRPGATVPAGRVAVAGVAWAPTRSVSRVEVRVDEDEWQRARLAGELSENTWVQWVFDWDAAPGEHRLQVRATDGTGETQTAERTPPAPSGATGYHTIHVEVR